MGIAMGCKPGDGIAEQVQGTMAPRLHPAMGISAPDFLLQLMVQCLQTIYGLAQFTYIPAQGEVFLPQGFELSFTIPDVFYIHQI